MVGFVDRVPDLESVPTMGAVQNALPGKSGRGWRGKHVGVVKLLSHSKATGADSVADLINPE